MKYDNHSVSESELHAYVDGQLDESRTRQLDSLVAERQELGQRVENYREINRRLGDVFSAGMAEPPPNRFLIALQRRAAPAWMRAAAAAALLIVGGLLGYALQDPGETPAFIRPVAVEAAFAHAVFVPEVRHPVEVGVAEQEHLNAWLSKRLSRPIAAPDLRGAGYALIGGRLLPDAHRPAAQFMFENEAGERITLFVRHAMNSRDSAFVYARQDELGIVYWSDEGLAYAVTGSADRMALEAVAELVYREANP